MPLMIDYCHLDVSDMHFQEIGAASGLMMFYKEQIGPGKIALLCDDDEQFGLGRQFQMMVEIPLDREIRVYRDEAAAICWLNALAASA
jgi:hypothetical protein